MAGQLKFVKVACIDPKFTGSMGRFRYINGLSPWMWEKDARCALACGSAVPTIGGAVEPYHSVCDFYWPEMGVPFTEDLCLKMGIPFKMPGNPTITGPRGVEAAFAPPPKPKQKAPEPEPEPEVVHDQEEEDLLPEEINATPSAKRLIDKKNLDPRKIVGHGSGGRITKDDVENFLAKGGGVV